MAAVSVISKQIFPAVILYFLNKEWIIVLNSISPRERPEILIEKTTWERDLLCSEMNLKVFSITQQSIELAACNLINTTSNLWRITYFTPCPSLATAIAVAHSTIVLAASSLNSSLNDSFSSS